jgi:hypothetical protein
MELSDNVLQKLSIRQLRLLAEITKCSDRFNTCKAKNIQKDDILECMMGYYQLCVKQNYHELNLQNKKNELAVMSQTESVNSSTLKKQVQILDLLEAIIEANEATIKANEATIKANEKDELKTALSKVQQLEKAKRDKKVIKYIDKDGVEKTVESFNIIYGDIIPYIEIVIGGQTRHTVLTRVSIEEDDASDDEITRDFDFSDNDPR